LLIFDDTTSIRKLSFRKQAVWPSPSPAGIYVTQLNTEKD